MVNKILLILILLNFGYSASFLDTVYTYRKEITKYFDKCQSNFVTPRKIEVPCCGIHENNEWYEYQDKSLKEWKTSKHRLIGTFFSLCEKTYKIEGQSYYLHDDFLIDLVIIALKDTTENDRINRDAFNLLFNKTTYSKLKEKKELIQNNLKEIQQRSNIFSIPSYYKLFLLCGVNDSDSVSSYKELTKYYGEKIPLFYTALLGDTASIDSLTEKLIKSDTYEKREALINFVGKIGGKYDVLFKYINEPIFRGRRECISKLILAPTIHELMRAFPNEVTFNDEMKYLSMNFVALDETEPVKKLLTKVYKWGKQTFNIEPVTKEPLEYIYISPCRNKR